VIRLASRQKLLNWQAIRLQRPDCLQIAHGAFAPQVAPTVADTQSYLEPDSYGTAAADLLAPAPEPNASNAAVITAQATEDTEESEEEGEDDGEEASPEENTDTFELEFEEGDTLRLTVTGTRTPIPIQNLPATVTVFELEDFDFYQVQGLQDLLRYEAGVSVRNNLQYGTQDVNIRGIEGNRVLFQVDNIRLPERFEFGPFNIGRGDYVDFATLQAVEVLRGASFYPLWQ
jgi:hemoglobin/transferrin/lactoferrin receptor protein